MGVRQTLAYEGDLHCRLTHGPSGVNLETDAPVDNHGRGASFSPTDLLASALVSCMVTVMAIAARQIGHELVGVTAQIEKTMSASPRRVARLEVEIAIPGTWSPADRELLQNAALTCPVKQSLHPEMVVDLRFVWGD